MPGADPTVSDDVEHFEDVFARYHSAIWRYLARLAGRERADDLAGEVFLVAFRRRSAYDPTRGSLSAWLYGIATNVLRNDLRSERRRAQAFARAAAEQITTASPMDDVDDRRARQAHWNGIVAALARLPARDREILALFAWEHLSYEEIAAALDVQIGTVRSRLNRTRQRLKTYIASGHIAAGETIDD